MGTGRDIFSAPWEPPFQAGELTTGIPEVGVTSGDRIALRNTRVVRIGSGIVATAAGNPEVQIRIVEAIDQVPPRPIDQL